MSRFEGLALKEGSRMRDLHEESDIYGGNTKEMTNIQSTALFGSVDDAFRRNVRRLTCCVQNMSSYQLLP